MNTTATATATTARQYADKLASRGLEIVAEHLDGADACYTANRDGMPVMVITAADGYAIAWPVPRHVTNPHLTAAQYVQASQYALMTATILH